MPETALKSELPESFQFSQSSLQNYADCPRLFQLRYIQRLAWPAIEMEPVLENERRQLAGARFHRMIQQHQIGLPVDKLSLIPDTPELQHWWENYLTAVEGMAGSASTKGRYVEQVLTAPVGTYHLLAKYDLLIISPDGKATIYDWKTSRQRPRDEWMLARWQTRVYRALVVQAGTYLNNGVRFEPEQVEMVYWFAEHPQEPARFPYDTAQYERDWDVLSGTIQEIARHRYFPASEEVKTCPYCTYRSYCNRGEKAGVGEVDGLEGDEAAGEFNLDLEQIAEIEF